MQTDPPVTVIGGGIIGLLCARELLQAGEAVVLLERDTIGRESSWAGGGILSPLYPWRYPAAVNHLAALSQAVYPDLCQTLRSQTDTDPECCTSGLLTLEAGDEDIAEKWADSASISIENLDSAQIHRLEPEAAGDFDSALWMPQIQQVRNPRLLAALRKDLLHAGLEIREQSPVTGFDVEKGQLQALFCGNERIQSQRAVVAGGAWSAELWQHTGMSLAVAPVRGQMLLFQVPPDMLKHILLHDHYYIIPRLDGHVLVGSTLEHVGFDKSTTQAARDELYQVALRMVPRLAQCELVGHWSGLRPGSPQAIPFISEHPTVSGLVVCSGHYRNGFVLGPASARLAVDLLLQRETQLDPGPYALPAD